MTRRAFLLGGVIALLIAVVTPWNDWAAKNTLIHGSYLPPILVFGLVVFVGLINPRLGRRRFVPAEIATMLVLVLVVGSVASIGLMRHFPHSLVAPALSLEKAGKRTQWSRGLSPEEVQAVVAEGLALGRQVVARHDRDRDDRLDAVEQRGLGLVLAKGDTNGDGGLDAAEIATGLLGKPDGLLPLIPGSWQAVENLTDATRPDSLDRQRVAGNFLQGTVDSRISAGAVFHLADAAGQVWPLHFLDGRSALEVLAIGGSVADPGSDPRAGALLALPIGESLAIGDGEWRLASIQAPGIPWGPWLRALLAWSPMILAMIAGALALAAIVRHQWAHHERLTMPIAKVLGSLVGQPSEVRPAIFSAKSLWITVVVVVLIHAIRTLNYLGWFPVTVPLELDLGDFRGAWESLDRAPDAEFIFLPKLYLTVVAVAFLMTSETSASMWGSLIVANLVAGCCISYGLSVSGDDLDKGGVGASWVLCLLILWIGRQHYLAVLAAAFGANRSAPAKEAAPWLWVLLSSCGLMVGFMVAGGVTLPAAISVTLITFASMLAIARVVAETGTPYVSFGANGRISGVIMAILGPTAGPAALMPLMMVGQVVGLGDRERLLPHVLHGLQVQEGTGKAGGPRLLLGIGIVCLGSALVSFLATVVMDYRLGAAHTDGFSQAYWGWSMWRADTVMGMPDAATEVQARSWYAYGIGAAVFGCLGLARLRWSWFALHPIGLIAVGGWVAKMCWASFLVGWLVKLAVLRYGSQSLYQRLFPVAMGLIVGEGLVVTVRMAIGLLTAWYGLDPIKLSVLPS